MGQTKNTPIGRASFPHLNELDSFKKYSITVLLQKSKPEVKSFMEELKEIVTREMITICGEKNLASGWQNFTAIKDGDKPDTFKTYRDNYAGHWLIALNRKEKNGQPIVVDVHKKMIDASEVYSGCDIICNFDVYGYNFNGRKSVTFGLQFVMKVRDNTPFASARPTAEAAFANLDIPEEALAQVVPAEPFSNVAAVTPQAPVANKTPVGNPFGGF